MKILGIDPGTKNLGYAIIEIKNKKPFLLEAGIVKIKSSILKEQIVEFIEGFDLIIKKHQIDEVAIEDIFFAFNPKTVLKLAQFRGAIILKIMQEFGEFSEYTPLQVKQTLTGKAKATKEQVSYMVRKIFSLKKDIKPYDITDAIAISYTHFKKNKNFI